MSSIFDDGMSLDFTIEARGPLPEFTGKYRLATPERTTEWRYDAFEKAKNGKERHKAHVLYIAEHIDQWSDARPINEESVRKLPEYAIVHLYGLISAYDFDARSKSEKKLRDALWGLWEHKIFSRPCNACERYEWDEEGDLVTEYDPVQRIELPVLRQSDDKPPCFACEKVPEKIRQQKQLATSKADAINLSAANLKVYTHWKGCHATKIWPMKNGDVDPHVKRHAGIIVDLLRQRDEQQVSSRLDHVIVLLSTLRAH